MALLQDRGEPPQPPKASHSPTPPSLLIGFGAAKHLSEQGYNVTLLEAAPTPGGLATGFRTASGREVEAGMKGFWYQVWIGGLDFR